MVKRNEGQAYSTEGFRDEAYKAIDSAESKAKRAIEEAEWAAKNKVNALSQSYGQLNERVSEKVGHAADTLKQWGKQLKDTSYASKDQLETRIKSRPIASAMVAFGVGMLAGRIFLGRNKQ